MSEEPDFHEYQHLLDDYDHLRADDVADGVSYGEFLQMQYDRISLQMEKYWNANEKVGRGRQGTKWRVKYKRELAKRDQVEQVFSELSDRGLLDEDLF